MGSRGSLMHGPGDATFGLSQGLPGDDAPSRPLGTDGGRGAPSACSCVAPGGPAQCCFVIY